MLIGSWPRPRIKHRDFKRLIIIIRGSYQIRRLVDLKFFIRKWLHFLLASRFLCSCPFCLVICISLRILTFYPSCICLHLLIIHLIIYWPINVFGKRANRFRKHFNHLSLLFSKFIFNAYFRFLKTTFRIYLRCFVILFHLMKSLNTTIIYHARLI